MPTIKLAQDVFESVTKAAETLGSGLVIGSNIAGQITLGNIIVQTPAYLKTGHHINVLD